jgi:thiamine biosynthesis lipoprotein
MNTNFQARSLIILAIIVGSLSFQSCKNDSSSTKKELSYQKIEGETMGTTYHVTYSDSLERNFKHEIDSLLIQINQEVSTYIPNSFISEFNKTAVQKDLLGRQAKPVAPHFYKNLEKCFEIYHLTDGAFDPTVMPLVNYWGFGYDEHRAITQVDSMKVDSLRRNFVGFRKIKYDVTVVMKTSPGVELDFSALAKGYGVDAVAQLLDERGCANYLVEIGGEVKAKGENSRGDFWVVGINTPKEGVASNDFQTTVALPNMALATSGNYRNFYQVDSLIFSHTINPNTGFPERTNLLSASIFARDCITADAIATACMVMGLDKAYDFALSQTGIEAYLIYGSNEGTLEIKYTPGLEKLIKN